MNTNQFLETFWCGIVHSDSNWPMFQQFRRPFVICKDGFGVSIQASEYHYCKPRISQIDISRFGSVPKQRGQKRVSKFKPYESVELGFPTEAVEEWADYAEDFDKPTDTVYGGVPVELVDRVLKKHGGIDIQQSYNCIRDQHLDLDERDEEWEKIEEIFLQLLGKEKGNEGEQITENE